MTGLASRGGSARSFAPIEAAPIPPGPLPLPPSVPSCPVPGPGEDRSVAGDAFIAVVRASICRVASVSESPATGFELLRFIDLGGRSAAFWTALIAGLRRCFRRRKLAQINDLKSRLNSGQIASARQAHQREQQQQVNREGCSNGAASCTNADLRAIGHSSQRQQQLSRCRSSVDRRSRRLAARRRSNKR